MSERAQHLPDHWANASVADLTEFVTSGSRGWAQHYAPDGPLFLRVGNLDHDSVEIDLSEIQHVRPPEGAEGERTSVEAGDVLLSITADVGMVGLVKDGMGEAYVNQHVALIRPRKGVWPPGLAFSFLDPQGLQALAKKAQHGATKQGLGLDQVRNFQVGVPPLGEQRRIVESLDSYFSRLDETTALLERVQRNLKRYRASVLKAAVEGRLVPTEAELARAEKRDYEPASVLLRRILAERRQRWEASGRKGRYVEPEPPDTSKLPDLPEGWCWATIEQLASHEKHSLSSGPFGSALGTKDYLAEGIPVVRGQNVRALSFVADGFVFISPNKADELLRSSVRSGDIVVVAVGASGRAAVVPEELNQGILSQNCNKISVEKTIADPSYIAGALQVGIARSQMDSRTTDTVRQFLSLTNLRQTCVPLPPRSEQVRIVHERDRALSLEENTSRQVGSEVALLRRLRQSILKWAFEGKLVDQDASDEPASALIDRIRTERAAQPADGQKRRRAMKSKPA